MTTPLSTFTFKPTAKVFVPGGTTSCARNVRKKLGIEYHKVCDPIWDGKACSAGLFLKQYESCFIKRFNMAHQCFGGKLDTGHKGALLKVLKNRDLCNLSKNQISKYGKVKQITTRNELFIKQMLSLNRKITINDLIDPFGTYVRLPAFKSAREKALISMAAGKAREKALISMAAGKARKKALKSMAVGKDKKFLRTLGYSLK